MTSPRRPDPAQGALDLDVARPAPLYLERAVRASVEAADLPEIDRGLGALAVELARACDVSAKRLDPYGVAAAGRELRETLTRLKLDPTARGDGDGDPIERLLADLNRPS